MLRRIEALGILTAAAVVITVFPPEASAQAAGPAAWQNDLKPIAPADWNYDFAAHLLERAGFGGTPAEIQALAKLTPAQAVARLVRFEGTDASQLPAFRCFRHSRSGPGTISSQPPRRNRRSQKERRGARHQSEAGRQPAAAARGQRIFLLAAR